MHSPIIIFHITTSNMKGKDGWDFPMVFLISHPIFVIIPYGGSWQGRPDAQVAFCRENPFLWKGQVLAMPTWKGFCLNCAWQGRAGPGLCGPRAPCSTKWLGFLHLHSFSVPADFRTLTSVTQDSFLLSLQNWVKISTCGNSDFFVWFCAGTKFSFLCL